MGSRVALVAAVVATPVVIALALILFVIEDGDGASPLIADTPPAASVGSGPPPVTAELTYTKTGLGVIDTEIGTGETPEAGQTLAVHYTGWLSNGTKFDSSLDRGSPFELELGAGHVIAGWDEGLATMKVGGKRRLIIPAELAYGEEGSAPAIPPNSELTFDIELLEIMESPSGP